MGDFLRWRQNYWNTSVIRRNLKGSGMAKLTQKEPRRTLVSDQIFADLNQERFIANGAVKLKYDEITDISGERLDWGASNRTV